MKRNLFFVLCLPVYLFAQGPAGPDRSICPLGSTTLGPQTPCANCCYKWSPAQGLDNPNAANPVVSGISITKTYSLTVSDMDGNFSSDEVVVTVYTPNIEIWEPEYRFPNTPIGEDQKRIPGAQTFVNLDNDDCDALFDDEDDDVFGGDNELIKIRVSLHIPGPPMKPGEKIASKLSTWPASVDPIPGTDMTGVRLWRSWDKSAGEYFPGTALDLDEVSPYFYEGYLWAEGIDGHSEQQQVKLSVRDMADTNPACTDNYAAITVIGIKEMTWIGIENGYTGNGANNSSVLDTDPNYTVAGVIGQRVFAEGKIGSVDPVPTLNKVKLKVKLSTVPPAPERIFLRSFDVDDPSSESKFIDPNDTGKDGIYAGGTGMAYTVDSDNRGTVTENEAVTPPNTIKEGFWIMGGTYTGNCYKIQGIVADEITPQFKVSLSPGDNYRVAVSNECSFLSNLRNEDQYDQHMIVDKCTSPVNPEGCIEIDATLSSPVLTVWRTLHVEYDRMKNPTWADNWLVKGVFTDFLGSLKNTNLIKGLLAPDPNAKSIPGYNEAECLQDQSVKGRFKDGEIRIGLDPVMTLCEPSFLPNPPKCILQNSPNSITLTESRDLTFGSSLPGKLYKGLLETDFNVQDILALGNLEFEVTLTVAIANLFDFNGGKVGFAGKNVTDEIEGYIEVLGNSKFKIKNSIMGGNKVSNLKIPIEIRDDDDIGPDNKIKPLSFELTRSIYQNVYLDVFPDGCGNLANNTEVPFARNLQPSELFNDWDTYTRDYYEDYLGQGKHSQSWNFNKPNYWKVYLLSGWQYVTKQDGDGKSTNTQSEPLEYGITYAETLDCEVADGGGFITICHEVIREGKLLKPGIDFNTVLPHEIGHSLGLSHGDKTISSNNKVHSCLGLAGDSSELMGLMQKSPSTPNGSQPVLISYHQNLIRSRIKSPSQL